jgi:hypothetical protein
LPYALPAARARRPRTAARIGRGGAAACSGSRAAPSRVDRASWNARSVFVEPRFPQDALSHSLTARGTSLLFG